MLIYHGCYNTFIMSEDLSLAHNLAEVIKLCQKYQTDGLIIFKNNPLEMILYNADGSRASMCGNGLRAFVKYGVDFNYITTNNVEVITPAGIMKVKILNYSPFYARANIGKPSYSAKKMHIEFPANKEEFFGELVTIDNITYPLYAIWTGTDHLVLIVSDFNNIERLAYVLKDYPFFPKGININFVKKENDELITLRTYERGVGWTKACGTGSSASVAVLNRLGLLKNRAKVSLLGGELFIEVLEDGIYMSGGAERLN